MDIGKSINVGCALFNKKKGDLAESIGKSSVTVSNYVKGSTQPSALVIKKIAGFFNVPASTFISWGE